MKASDIKKSEEKLLNLQISENEDIYSIYEDTIQIIKKYRIEYNPENTTKPPRDIEQGILSLIYSAFWVTDTKLREGSGIDKLLPILCELFKEKDTVKIGNLIIGILRALNERVFSNKLERTSIKSFLALSFREYITRHIHVLIQIENLGETLIMEVVYILGKIYIILREKYMGKEGEYELRDIQGILSEILMDISNQIIEFFIKFKYKRKGNIQTELSYIEYLVHILSGLKYIALLKIKSLVEITQSKYLTLSTQLFEHLHALSGVLLINNVKEELIQIPTLSTSFIQDLFHYCYIYNKDFSVFEKLIQEHYIIPLHLKICKRYFEENDQMINYKVPIMGDGAKSKSTSSCNLAMSRELISPKNTLNHIESGQNLEIIGNSQSQNKKILIHMDVLDLKVPCSTKNKENSADFSSISTAEQKESIKYRTPEKGSSIIDLSLISAINVSKDDEEETKKEIELLTPNKLFFPNALVNLLNIDYIKDILTPYINKKVKLNIEQLEEVKIKPYVEFLDNLNNLLMRAKENELFPEYEIWEHENGLGGRILSNSIDISIRVQDNHNPIWVLQKIYNLIKREFLDNGYTKGPKMRKVFKESFGKIFAPYIEYRINHPYFNIFNIVKIYVNNLPRILGSVLINKYLKLDNRIFDFAVFIFKWVSNFPRNLKAFSGESLLSIIIFFFQIYSTPGPILPSFHKIALRENIEKIHQEIPIYSDEMPKINGGENIFVSFSQYYKENINSLYLDSKYYSKYPFELCQGELLAQFFNFYGNQYPEYISEGRNNLRKISIRKGKFTTIDREKDTNSPFVIEDPFNKTKNMACNLSFESAEYIAILHEFREAFRYITAQDDPRLIIYGQYRNSK